MFRKNPVKFCNILCIILMACLLICQFLPFWHYGDTDVSINGFVWFPKNHVQLETTLSEALGTEVTINDIVRSAVLLLILCVAGIIAGIYKSESSLLALLPLAAGCTGLWQYLGKPVFRLSSCWWFHLCLSIALVLVSAMCIYLGIQRSKAAELKK